MLNVEFIENEWIPALESGNFEKGVGCLSYQCSGRKHCCLGVAAELLFSRLDYKWVADKTSTAEKALKAIRGHLTAPFLDYIGITLKQQEELIVANDANDSLDYQPVIKILKQIVADNKK